MVFFCLLTFTLRTNYHCVTHDEEGFLISDSGLTLNMARCSMDCLLVWWIIFSTQQTELEWLKVVWQINRKLKSFVKDLWFSKLPRLQKANMFVIVRCDTLINFIHSFFTQCLAWKIPIYAGKTSFDHLPFYCPHKKDGVLRYLVLSCFMHDLLEAAKET